MKKQTQTKRPATSGNSKKLPSRRGIPLGWILPAAVVVFWFVAYSLELVNPVMFSSPIEVAKAFWEA
ncbi:MAG: hypothetical protein ACTIJ6_05000, partial [Leucobacter sp.]